MKDKDEAIFDLGREIVREMKLEESTDTVGRWMAHHVAELIEEAKEEIGSDQNQKTDKCREAIIEIWKYRSGQIGRKANFGRSESLLSVLRTDPWASRLDAESVRTGSSQGSDDWILMTRQVTNSGDELRRVMLAIAARSIPETERNALENATDADLLDDEANSLVTLIKWSNAESRRGTNWIKTVEKTQTQLEAIIQQILRRLNEESSN